MLSDQVSNPGPLTYESGALPIALRGPVNNVAEIREDISLPKDINQSYVSISSDHKDNQDDNLLHVWSFRSSLYNVERKNSIR